ncbi:hypothetical protein Tco_0801260 [Tanacetum coccineum]|uniref:Uncharacterized protein n=1 Tax=Tanacetum coccineum TaxID=301880 RepID=A0ABQ4ZWB5_9ASTR
MVPVIVKDVLLLRKGIYGKVCLTNCVENEFFKDFQDTSESSNDNTNVVNAPREPIVVNQDPGENSSPSPPHIDHCCHECGDSLDGIFCRQCTFGNGTQINVSIPYSSNDSPSVANHPPQPQYVPYSRELRGNDSHYGYDCQPLVPFYVNHPIFNSQNELLNSQNKLMEQMATLRELVDQAIQKKEEEKRIAEEQAARDRSWKIPICYDDDEDDTIAITPVLPIEEPNNFFISMFFGDEHLDTIPETESDEFIKSSVEDLVPIPSESEGIPDKMCDVPLYNNPTSLNALNEHSEIVVNSDDDNSSSDDDFSTVCAYRFVDAHLPTVEISGLYHEDVADELTHIMSLPELECFKFKIEPDPGDLTSIDLGIRKNASTTNVNVPLEDDQSSLFTYVVWIFLAFLTYPVVPPYLLSTGNEDTIFDPGISIYHSFMPDVSYRSGTFMKFNERITKKRTKNKAKTTKRGLGMNRLLKDKSKSKPVVVVVAIIGVVVFVTIIGIIVVVGGVPSIIKLSFVGHVHSTRTRHWNENGGNPLMKTSISFSAFGTMFGHKTANSWNLLMSSSRSGVPVGITITFIDAACAFRAEEMPSLIILQEQRNIEDLSNSNDGGNTGDGVKIAGEVIGSGDEIEFSEELKELLPDEAGK